MSAPQDEWDGILEPGEKVLWQGRPGAGFKPTISHLVDALRGAAAMAVGIVFVLGADFLPFLVIGVFLILTGFYMLAGRHLWQIYENRHYTWYTLTNKRAFIGRSDPFGNRSLETYKLCPDTMLELVPGERPSVYFSHEVVKRRDKEVRRRIGFESVADGDTVFRLMRDVQEGRV